MNILSIETSCDETGVSVVSASGSFPHGSYTVKGNGLFSQIDIHKEYGGVFPAVAKREHAKTLVPMLERALKEAEMLTHTTSTLSPDLTARLSEILIREDGLADALIDFFSTTKQPDIDLISVTVGPGLEPALWVGISFARALSYAWNVPIIPANHMEGHILSSVFDGHILSELAFPAIALLISGGHTELILMRDWISYKKVGETRDDAVGEAFDKVARMLGLPYPGGPEISHLAKSAREKRLPEFAPLPRPMIDSPNSDFSFSGLKTAVRYAIEGKTLSHAEKMALSRDFEDAVTEVLLRKTVSAIDEYGAETLIVGGGVSANTYIREKFTAKLWKSHPMVTVYLPPPKLSTDNSVMIALVGHARATAALKNPDHPSLVARGNLSLEEFSHILSS